MTTEGEKTTIQCGRQTVSVLKYLVDEKWTVLVGRTDHDNDLLSLKVAQPRDWWFHVRGMPGSHVILRVKNDEEPERAVLKSAAAITAYHSKARTGGVVAVTATRAMNVSKPRGAKVGTVTIKRETVFKVRPGLPTPVNGATRL